MNYGWSIDISTRGREHYYINGVSLCKKVNLKFFMKTFTHEKGSKWTGQCAICCKKQLKLKP